MFVESEIHKNITYFPIVLLLTFHSKEGINMKSTGIVRKVDELGRIVLPIELRRTLNIDIKDSIEIYVDNSTIVLKKYEPTCIFCGESENVVTYKEKNVCKKCLEDLKNT